MMRKKRDRPLKELYDLTHRISQPEITPVLRGSCRIQGPMDDSEHDIQMSSAGFQSEKNFAKHNLNENLHTRAVSGTCNVCAAPCSSCMHNGQRSSAMESKVEGASSENTVLRKEADNCSFTNTDMTPLYESRQCDDRHHAASEGSNFFSASSSHDSFSENAESKAAIRTPDTYNNSEDVDMPLKVSPMETNSGDGHLENVTKQQTINAHGLHPSRSHTVSDSLHRTISGQDEEKHRLECHGDNISCISGVRDVNMEFCDINTESHRKNVPSSPAVASESPVKSFKKSVQVQIAFDKKEDIRSTPRRMVKHTNESSQKSSTSNLANAGLSEKASPPETDDPSLKVHSPRISNSSFCGTNSKDVEENSSNLPKREPSENSMEQGKSTPVVPMTGSVEKTDDPGSVDILPDDGNSKACLVKSDFLSEITDNISKSVKNDNGGWSENLSDELMKSDMRKEVNGNSTTLEKSVTESQPVQENMEPEILEDDVKVCDICGDAGREDLLAICSRCSDGAEHTYCMRIMLDKVPDGEWLCEECKFKEEAENKKDDKSEAAAGMSRAPSLNEKCQDFGSTSNAKDLPKLDGKSLTATQAVKGPQIPLTSKRHPDNVEAGSTSKKQDSVPSRKTSLLRDSSFKNLDITKGRPGNMSPLSRSYSANNAQVGSHTFTSSGPNSSKTQAHSSGPNTSRIQTQHLSPRGSLTKPSVDNIKPKVKHVVDNAVRKSKLTIESSIVDAKKEEMVRALGKSASFKNVSSNRSSMDATCKNQHVNRTEDSRSTGQGKDRAIIENKNSFKHVNSSPLVATGTSSLKTDPKAAGCDGKFSSPPESNTSSFNKGSEDARGLVGLGEVKQQPSYSEKSTSSNGTFASEDQKPGQPILGQDTVASSSVNDKTREPIVQHGLLQSWQSTTRDMKNREPISSSSSRQAVSSGGKLSRCQRCNETGHATQFCSIDKIRCSALKPSGERVSRDVANKGNKWRDAVDAAFLKTRIHKNNRLPDQPDKLPPSSADLGNKMAPKDQSMDSSTCVRNSTGSEGTVDMQENLRNFTGNTKKTTILNDTKQQALLPTEVAFVSRGGDAVTNADALKCTPVMQMSSERVSMHPNLLRVSAIPELNYIWQGAFEVHRSRRLSDVCDGIQAHLSSCASPKVLEVVTSFPTKIPLEEVPCATSWPLQFQRSSPTEENIALFFFATDNESYERNYKKLLENMLKNDLALRGNLDGTEFLIFPSNKLPERSQRWNKLFFLWGVFRGKKPSCVEAVSDFPKKLCSPNLIVEHPHQAFPSSAPFNVSVSQNASSTESHIKMDVSKSTAPTNLTHVPASESEKIRNFNLNEQSLDNKVPHQVVIDINIPSENQPICSFSEVISLNSKSKQTILLDNCSKQVVGADAVQICSELKERTPCSKELICDPRGKNIEFASVPETGSQIGLSEDRVPHSNVFTDDCSGFTKICQSSSSVSVQSIGALGDKVKANGKRREERAASGNVTQENTGPTIFSWDLRANRKRSSSYSPDPIPPASGETLTREALLLKEQENLLPDKGKEPKKAKLYHDNECGSNNRGDAVQRFSSKVHPLFFSETSLPECSRSSERYFFPVSSGSHSRSSPGTVLPWQPVSLDEPDTPNLELALGAKNSGNRQEILPLFFPLAENRNDNAKPPDIEDNDASASLSLSLAFPFPDEEQSPKRTEQLLPEKRDADTSLILFGSFVDT